MRLHRASPLLFSLVLFAPPAFGQTTTRVSVDSAGVEGNDVSQYASISANGRFVAFSSRADNLVPGDTNRTSDVFVHDRQTGTTTRVSLDSAGVQGKSHSGGISSISATGRCVAFSSAAPNLVPGDTNGSWDVFVRDRQVRTTTRVSISSQGAEGNALSGDPSMSWDGRFVAFWSFANNLVPRDTNGADVFVHDRRRRTTARVSVDSAGVQANGRSLQPSVSADGRFVSFLSDASNLVPGDTNRTWDVFVHDRQTGATTRASVSSAGVQANAYSDDPAISGDGRFVAFMSFADNLVPRDTNSTYDVFVHDRRTATTTRVSVDSAGIQGNGTSRRPSISVAGRFVAFWSAASNLVVGDTDGHDDIFVHDRQTGATTRASVDATGIQANGGSQNPSISALGRFVAFASIAGNLVPGDTNDDADIFVRDRISLTFNGVAARSNPVNFTVSSAFGESGNLAWVLLSCSGTAGFPPDGRTVPLTLDACTLLSLGLPVVLSAVIAPSGTANAPIFAFPALPPGITLYSSAVTLDLAAPSLVSLTGPISFVTR